MSSLTATRSSTSFPEMCLLEKDNTRLYNCVIVSCYSLDLVVSRNNVQLHGYLEKDE